MTTNLESPLYKTGGVAGSIVMKLMHDEVDGDYYDDVMLCSSPGEAYAIAYLLNGGRTA